MIINAFNRSVEYNVKTEENITNGPKSEPISVLIMLSRLAVGWSLSQHALVRGRVHSGQFTSLSHNPTLTQVSSN